MRLSWWLNSKESTCNAGNSVLILGLGRSPEEGWQPTLVFFVWEIPWTEEPGRLQSIESQRVRHDLATKQQLWITLTELPPPSPHSSFWHQGWDPLRFSLGKFWGVVINHCPLFSSPSVLFSAHAVTSSTDPRRRSQHAAFLLKTRGWSPIHPLPLKVPTIRMNLFLSLTFKTFSSSNLLIWHFTTLEFLDFLSS